MHRPYSRYFGTVTSCTALVSQILHLGFALPQSARAFSIPFLATVILDFHVCMIFAFLRNSVSTGSTSSYMNRFDYNRSQSEDLCDTRSGLATFLKLDRIEPRPIGTLSGSCV